MSFLTGKPSSETTKSGNNAYPWIAQNYGGGGAQAFNAGMGGIGSILGLPGYGSNGGGGGGTGTTTGGGTGTSGAGAAGSDPLSRWFNSSGGQFLLNQGVDNVNANMSARGLGNSGADMKGLEDYRQGLASTKLNEYLQNLMGFSQLGLGAGGLVSDAGKYSTGRSTGATQGLGQLIGSALAFIPK